MQQATQAKATEPVYGEVAEEQQSRAGVYSLLAELLRHPPAQESLDRISQFADVDASIDDIALATSMLGLAAKQAQAAAIDDEYHVLFIGLGRGELVPFASWYLTGFLLERPLAVLREDLQRLGYQRQQGTKEPEDHVAALFEVMSLMIADGRDHDTQSKFFMNHINSWIQRFFEDLNNADSAVFYRAVGRFGLALMKFEANYLAAEV